MENSIGTDLESILGTRTLLAAAGYAYYLIIQRMQALVASPFEVAFFQNFWAIVLLPAVPRFFTMPTDPDVWGGLFIAAVLATDSVLLMTGAYRQPKPRN